MTHRPEFATHGVRQVGLAIEQRRGALQARSAQGTRLSKAHQLGDVANPARDPAVQELVRRVRRAYAVRGVRPDRKTAITKDPLEAMLATCTDDLIGIRDRALLLFTFSTGGRRRSEVSAAVMENLLKVNADTYVYHLTHSKTDQAGTEHNPDEDKPVLGPAAQALTAWLEASGVTSGAIFRRTRKAKQRHRDRRVALGIAPHQD